jgi:hypothetical protein
VPTGGTRLVDSQDELTNKPSTKKEVLMLMCFVSRAITLKAALMRVSKPKQPVWITPVYRFN